MRILIVRNNYNPKALESALLLEVYLASQGVEFTAFDTDDLRASSEFFQRRVENIDDFDLAVVLGGDGTILHEANLSLQYAKPILGINLGRCGFLATCEISEMEAKLSAVARGEFTLDNRMLRCTVGNDVRDWKDALACFFEHWDGDNGMK